MTTKLSPTGRAYLRGLRAGADGVLASENPYRKPHLRAAWEEGRREASR